MGLKYLGIIIHLDRINREWVILILNRKEYWED